MNKKRKAGAEATGKQVFKYNFSVAKYKLYIAGNLYHTFNLFQLVSNGGLV